LEKNRICRIGETPAGCGYTRKPMNGLSQCGAGEEKAEPAA